MFISNWLICPPVHCSIIIDQLFGDKSPLVVESVRLPGAGDCSLPPWFVNVELADPANCLQSSGSRDPGFWILDPWSIEPAKCLLVISGPKTLFLFCLGDWQTQFPVNIFSVVGINDYLVFYNFCMIFTFCEIFRHGILVRGVLWGQEMSRPRQGYFCECHVTLLYTLS